MQQHTDKEMYRLSAEEVLKLLSSDKDDGLNEHEVELRTKHYGTNELVEDARQTIIDRIVSQLRGPLAFILLVAGIVTTFLAEYIDATVIFIALIINIAISLYQEGRADKAFERLRAFQEKSATVIRDKEKKVIPSIGLVPGDIIVLEAGMSVPADARIITANNLEANESQLSGEWIDVEKHSRTLNSVLPLAERKNLLFMSTVITAGTGIAVVVATGNDTAIGNIALQLNTKNEPRTPLEDNIANIAKLLSYIILSALVGIFVLGMFRGIGFTELLLISIAIAVAAIPEGLPPAVTVGLAIGMEALLKRGGLVRNLLAAETLGSTTLIITDKTGTLTRGEMRVDEVITLGTLLLEERRLPDDRKTHEAHGDERDVLEFATLASDAFVEEPSGKELERVVRGRPVERAVVDAALRSGFDQGELLRNYPRVDFLPFASMYRIAVSLHVVRGMKHHRLYITGAPEVLLDHAKEVYLEGNAVVLTEERRAHFHRVLKKHAGDGMRLIAVAYGDTAIDKFPPDNATLREKLLDKIVFAGLIALHDPVREDVPEAIKTAIHAGARVIMATGDNPETARTIALECGIGKKDDEVLTGMEIEKLDDEELLKRQKHLSVFARMAPEHKMRLVRLFQSQGEVVAMTGDGVNDAPALRAANIGVALGSGTDVAKESSDIILLNNSFSIIVTAIEEGRRIIDNLRKIVVYLLSTSGSEIIIVGGALVAGLPLPLLPAQILWTNMLTEGFMNFAFAFEPKEDDLMERDPKLWGARTMLSRKLTIFMIVIGVLTGAVLLGFYWYLLSVLHLTVEDARTLMFAALTLGVTLIAFSLKDLRSSIMHIRFWSNRYLIGSLLFAIAGLFGALYFPPLETLLRLSAVDLVHFAPALIGLIAVNIAIVEIAKYFTFERRKGS